MAVGMGSGIPLGTAVLVLIFMFCRERRKNGPLRKQQQASHMGVRSEISSRKTHKQVWRGRTMRPTPEVMNNLDPQELDGEHLHELGQPGI